MPFLVAAVDRALQDAGVALRGQTIVVGLSGGPDSVALTDALAALRRRRGFRLVAAHLDHSLRPDSAEDAAFCQSLCDALALPLRGGTAPVRERARRERGGLEQAARRERYSFLRRVQQDEGASAIAVAHTEDDQAETLLLRLLRGAGASGLSGMRARRGELLRPLLGVSRARVLEHLRERGLGFREDPSNADTAHLRNRVRHELLPYLERRFNPRVKQALARSAALLADEAAHMRGQAQELFTRIATLERRRGDQDAAVVVLDRPALAAAPPALARSAVRLALDEAGGLSGVALGHVERLLRLARSAAPSGRRLALPGGREARFTHRELRVEKRAFRGTKAVSSSRPRR